MPVPAPPAKSCDSQFHIFGEPQAYPPKENSYYQPPEGATFDDARGMLSRMGFERGVIVNPMPYDTDHRLLVDVLESLSPQDRKNFRATGIVKDHVSDSVMAQLDSLGVRGARFNIGAKYQETYTLDSIRRSMDRVREIGWHAKIHVGGADIITYGEFLSSIKNLTMVLDHMGHLDFTPGLRQPACQWMLNMLNDENWWMLLSNGNRDSVMESGWDDAVPFGAAYFAAAPDRMIWGSDWPHIGWKKRMMNDAETVELLYRYVDHDADLIDEILVHNPSKLYDFDD
jgi:predicted TIM-barrel fold metal-dependent hydrolase